MPQRPGNDVPRRRAPIRGARQPGPWWRRRPPGPRGRRLAALFWLALVPGWAAAGTPGGFFLGAGDDWRRAPTIASEATIDIAGMVARVEIRQSFSHDGPVPLEGRYLFPLPEDAAVDTLELRVGGRRVLGEVREREEARARYLDARAEGRRAGLLEQERPNLFSLAVAHVPPGETVHVHIGYYQQARFRDGRFDLALPLTVTPRYLPGNAEAPPLPAAYRPARADGGLGLSIRLAGGVEIEPPDFSGQRMDARLAGEGTAVEYVPASGRIPLDRDFRMSWAPRLGGLPEAAVFRERFGDEEYALVMLVPPPGGDVLPRPREVVLVIDTSGSMAGEPLRQARAALARALERLSPEDRFNVIAFDSDARALFPGPVPARGAFRRIALDHVRTLDAQGGTLMAPAIELALAGAGGERLRQVVFVTDGAVDDETALFALIRERLGSSRLFTVGIGAAPNGHFMTQAALWGRGTHVRIGDLSEVSERIDALLARLERPALTDIEVSFPELAAVEVWPERVPDLYAGEPVLIAARLDRPAGSTPRLRLQGRSADGHWLRQLTLPAGEDAPGVAAVWARSRMAGLERRLIEGADPEAVRSELVETALAHGLVSRYTSLVAVDPSPPVPGADPSAPGATVPLVAPAGADGVRLAAVSATATSAGQRYARALILLFLALLVWAFDPRRAPRWD